MYLSLYSFWSLLALVTRRPWVRLLLSTPFQTLLKSIEINTKPVYSGLWPVSYLLLSTGLNRNQVTVGGISGGIMCSVQGDAPNEA